MTRHQVQTAALVAAVFFTAPVWSQGGATDPDLAKKGKQIYYINCTRCHGVNMVSSAAGFFDLRTFPANEKPRFVDSVTNGKRAMPAWGATLKSDDIDALWAYVMTAKK